MHGMHTDLPNSDPLTRSIIGCAFAVANGLGPGFFEKVYENALANKLRDTGHAVEQQRAVDVRFEGRVVGTYVADLMIDDAVVVELKAVAALNNAHVAQCLNFLKASGLRSCLLLNFGTRRLEIRRVSGPA